MLLTLWVKFLRKPSNLQHLCGGIMASSEENEVYESWEELEDSEVLDRKMKILQSKQSVDTSQQKESGVVILQDESLRSQYGPPEPMVKILKRPTRPCDSSQVNGDSRPRQFKTLQQREQEYAEARLRILGEARSPEEVVAPSPTLEGVSRLQSKMEVLKTSDQENMGRSKLVTESDNILRAPRGPDGTKGFSRR